MSRAAALLLLALAACGVKGPPRPPGQETVRGVLPEPKTRGVTPTSPPTSTPTPTEAPTEAPTPAPAEPPPPTDPPPPAR